jgi:hypothetical protein
MALGAHRGDVLRLFVRQGMTTVALASLKEFIPAEFPPRTSAERAASRLAANRRR